MKTIITPSVPKAGRVMITNGGAHPPEAWAQVTSEGIAPLGPDLIGKRRRAGIELQGKIADALETVYGNVQTSEQGRLKADTAQVSVRPDPTPHLDDCVAAVRAAVKGSEWEAQFSTPAAETFMRREIGIHVASIQYIEKSRHADRNPDHPAAVALRTQRAGRA